MTSHGTPAADIEIDANLVRALLREQQPHLATAPIKLLASGWDNDMFRVGNDLIARLPRRREAVPLIANEAEVLTHVEPLLPAQVPAPAFRGQPGCGYPWAWHLVRWIDGETAAQAPLGEAGAGTLSRFWSTLHSLDPTPFADRLTPNPVRGVPLSTRTEPFETRRQKMVELGEPLTSNLDQIWQDALHAPLAHSQTLLQGDPHARNMISANGDLVAVIDWGDVTIGDPASDLASFWMLLHDDDMRSNAIAHYQASAQHADMGPHFNALLKRARGWALLYALMLRVTGLVDHPLHAQMGRQTLLNLER